MIEENKIYCGNCLDVMKEIKEESIDLVVTSPPYDKIRDYKGFVFDYKKIVKELYRVMRQGGVVVWVVGDQTKNGSETGSSFKQALYFKYVGFRLHDTMIWEKEGGFSDVGSTRVRYAQCFEYMFVFIKGQGNTFNPLRDRVTKGFNLKIKGGGPKKKDGICQKLKSNQGKIYCKDGKGIRYNIWKAVHACGKELTGHPAPFPESIVEDHILSWSNEGDLVFDPMCGGGTTCKMAIRNKRRFIGCDISEEYCEMAKIRVRKESESRKGLLLL